MKDQQATVMQICWVIDSNRYGNTMTTQLDHKQGTL